MMACFVMPLAEVLVFGSGAAIMPLPPALVQQLEAKGIGLEVSNTVRPEPYTCSLLPYI